MTQFLIRNADVVVTMNATRQEPTTELDLHLKDGLVHAIGKSLSAPKRR